MSYQIVMAGFRLLVIIEAVMLSFSCSLDAFAVSLAYGSERIHIPIKSALIIDFICSLALGLSLIAGSIVYSFLPEWITKTIAFMILMIIGIIKLLDSVTKSIIRRHNKKSRENLKKELRFSLFNFSFILNLYANPVDADVNVDKTISPREAMALAVSLSPDGFAAGFGAGFGAGVTAAALTASLILHLAAVVFGCRIGRQAAKIPEFNISWLSGAILIALAIYRFLLSGG